MIKPVSDWASSYETTWKKVFDDAQGEGFNAQAATAEAWQKWNNDNAKEMKCIAPIAPAPQVSATTNPTAMAPLDFSGSSSPPQAAKILASAWQAWASAIVWTPVPPAPPFSAIAQVITDPASISAAYTALLSGLIAEMAVVPANDAGVQAKYKAMGTLFYTAAITLKVQFIGASMSAPPAPLMIPVPVF